MWGVNSVLARATNLANNVTNALMDRGPEEDEEVRVVGSNRGRSPSRAELVKPEFIGLSCVIVGRCSRC